MAVTRSSAARARLFDLLALPDDLLLKVALHALAMEVPAALRLLQTCKALQARLGAIGAEAAALKLCWLEAVVVACWRAWRHSAQATRLDTPAAPASTPASRTAA